MRDTFRNRCGRTLVAALLAAGLAAGAAAETLKLNADAAARRALEVSHGAAAAAQRVAGASSKLAAADAARMPTISAGATVQERSSVPELAVRFDPTGPPLTIFPDIRTAYNVGLDVTQPLYTGGSVTAARAASRHELDAARADESSTRSAVALNARLAYWRTAADLASVDTAKSQQRRAERLLEDAHSLRQAGMAVDADVLAGEARTAAARLAVIRAQTAADDAMAALRSLLQVPSGTTVELADAMPATLPAAPAPLPALQEQARKHRPEIDALAARVEALGAREEVAGAASRPTVGASAQWDLARPNQRYLPMKDEWNDSWSIAIAARWKLWDGGRTGAETAVVRAEKRALAEELADARRRVDLDVERARLQVESALAAVTAADASRQAAAARLTAEEERYQAGLATTSDVLAAQADLAAAETQQVEARTGAWTASARLDWAVGR